MWDECGELCITMEECVSLWRVGRLQDSMKDLATLGLDSVDGSLDNHSLIFHRSTGSGFIVRECHSCWVLHGPLSCHLGELADQQKDSSWTQHWLSVRYYWRGTLEANRGSVCGTSLLCSASLSWPSCAVLYFSWHCWQAHGRDTSRLLRIHPSCVSPSEGTTAYTPPEKYKLH